MKRAGFTLIELLVVIAIIAVLSTIGLSAFTSAQARARDARRMGDMKAIQDSFEQYNSANGSYAAVGTMSNSLAGGVLPVDPRPAPYQGYTVNYNAAGGPGGAQAWCACALLENAGKGNATGVCPNSGIAPFAASGNYFCVRNLQ